MKENMIKKLSIGLLIIILAVIPYAPQLGISLGMMVFIGIYTIVVIGMVMLMGYAGQISLGHAAFYGLGAYTTTIVTVKLGYPSLVGVISACVVSGLVAAVIGRPTLKLKEHYLALATLGFGIVIYILFNEGGELTGGPSGIFGIPPLSIGSFKINNDTKFYYLVWILVGITMLIAQNIVNSRVGRAIRAIHSSEVAAESMGVDTAKYKLQVFILSAVLAGLAGSLYAHYVSFISPSPFSFKVSVEFVLMAVVGGLTSIWGPIFGVALVVFLSETLKTNLPLILPQAGGEFEIIIFGIILVLVMIFLPEGLASIKDVIKEKIVLKKRPLGSKAKGDYLEGKVKV
jgi:branched-chain amino acid transport system permease protein